MRLITWNVNGLRAVERKGELEALIAREAPDALLLQEIKGEASQFSPYLTEHPDYVQFYSSAVKKGYSGVGLWMRRSLYGELGNPEFLRDIPGLPNSDEGRVAWLRFERTGRRHELFSIYFPNGGKSDEAWRQKLVFFDAVHAHMSQLREQGSSVIVGGDMNVAHEEIDLARPKENDGKIGFHPDERAWMDRLAEDGWSDCWRERNPGVTEVYSWWDMATRARTRNVGWRIDYFLLDRGDLHRVRDIEYLTGQMGSDHCPLVLGLDD